MTEGNHTIRVSSNSLLVDGSTDMPGGDFVNAGALGSGIVVVSVGFNDDTTLQPLVYAKNLTGTGGWELVIPEMSFTGTTLISHGSSGVSFG
jgi:hypothetical protein